MGTWKATQIPLPPQLPPGGQIDMSYVKTLNDYVKQLAHTISSIRNDLEFMLNGNLDVKNIRANSITADRLDVKELSAISANLGKITSGEIYGAYIATREGEYPRAEMNSDENLFGAYSTANNYLTIQALPGPAQSPQMIIAGPSSNLTMFVAGLSAFLSATGASLNLSSNMDISIRGRNINLTPDNGNFDVKVPFDQLKDTFTNQTLYVQLLGKANSGSQTGSAGASDGGIPIGTVLRTADGGTVTWRGVSSHTHTQN